MERQFKRKIQQPKIQNAYNKVRKGNNNVKIVTIPKNSDIKLGDWVEIIAVEEMNDSVEVPDQTH